MLSIAVSYRWILDARGSPWHVRVAKREISRVPSIRILFGRLEVIDAQVHLWERDHPARPWVTDVARPPNPAALQRFRSREMTPETMLAEMATVGVDAAIVVSPSTTYRFDCSYALEAAQSYPDKFGVVGPIDPIGPDVASQIRNWRHQPGALGLRILIQGRHEGRRLRAGRYSAFLSAAERDGVPVCISAPGRFADIAWVARAHPDLQLVVDHMGLPSTQDADQLRQLPRLLALAKLPNVAIKLTAVPIHSREDPPFRDLWPPLHRVIDTFGLHRLMWGSDWTRVTGVLTYQQGLDYLTETSELSPSDKERLLGKTLREIFRWVPEHQPQSPTMRVALRRPAHNRPPRRSFHS